MSRLTSHLHWWQRAHAFLYKYDTELVEMKVASTALFAGIWIIWNPYATFTAPLTWGYWLVGLGMVHLLAVMLDRPMFRSAMVIITVPTWCYIAVSMLYERPWSAAIPFVLSLCIGSIMLFFRVASFVADFHRRIDDE